MDNNVRFFNGRRLIEGGEGGALRTFATPGEVHVDALMTDYATNFGNAGFVGDVLFPTVPVQKRSNKFAIFNAARKDLRVQNTLRAPRTAAKVVDWDVTFDNYAVQEFALAAGVDDQERDNADTPIDPEQRATAMALIGIALDRENRIATKARLAATYSGTHVVALAGVNQWSAPTTSDPKTDVDNGRMLVQQDTGVLPNTMVLPIEVLNKLKAHPKITDAIKFTQFGIVTTATVELLKQFFEIDNIVIAGAMRNTAAEGAGAVIARIWGKDVVLAFVDPNSSPLNGISFGKTFRAYQNGMLRLVRNFREEKARTTWYEVDEATDEKVTARDCGFLLQTVIA